MLLLLDAENRRDRGRDDLAVTCVTFEQRGEPWPLSPAAESALPRVAQEALANAARHARATRVDVILEYAADAVRLVVCDGGVG